MKKIEIIGFHATSQNNVHSIINDGFTINTIRDNEWLGHGIYLFKYKADAESWAKGTHYCKPNPTIIKCYAEVKEEKYLDLDDPEKMDYYLKYYNEVLEALSDRDKVIEFKNKEQAMCYGLNIYKKYNNIDAIKYTFTNPRTSRIMKYEKNELGYSYNEAQICISRNEIINEKVECS